MTVVSTQVFVFRKKKTGELEREKELELENSRNIENIFTGNQSCPALDTFERKSSIVCNRDADGE